VATFTALYSFGTISGALDPLNPAFGSFVQGRDGLLYDNSENGGIDGSGTIYSMTLSGTYNIVYDFINCSSSPTGCLPFGGLTLGSDGNFYGTTNGGGTGPDDGAIYQVTPGGMATALHDFMSTGDGMHPYTAPVQGNDGNFYGTTAASGDFGQVYKVTTGMVFTTLHVFTNMPDGDGPWGLVLASDGNFYGTTSSGGASGLGTIYKITSAGVLTILHNFDGTDGSAPTAQLIQGTDGKLYGSASLGGASSAGVVFRIATNGSGYTVLHNLNGTTDGSTIEAPLVQATDGNFYGTAFAGGVPDGDGTIFKMTPGGGYSTVHNFIGTDGKTPRMGLYQHTNGILYSATPAGGTSNHSGGVFFSLNIGAAPFARLMPTSGKVGSKVNIFGQGFSAASVVKFGGVQAITVTRQGTTFLKATVPAGAISGKVTVTTGATTLTSAQTYTVHDSWSSAAPLPTARQGAAAGAIGGKLYVVGGATNSAVVSVNEIYNSTTNTWSTGASLPTARWAVAYAVVSNILYVIGGSDTGGSVTNIVEAYNPTSNTWSTKSPMPTARNSITTAVENGKIYVVGGANNSGSRLTTVESYDPTSDTWTTEAPLLVGKSYSATGLLSTTIVSADGFDNSGMVIGDNEGYNAINNSWSDLTADPAAREATCASSISGLLYDAGGWNGAAATGANESFKLATGHWTTLAAMPTAAVAPASASLNNVLYCVGGSNNGAFGQGMVFNNVQIYQP
jgi:uncharacterized repeat protein (TIGR03803 family)